MLQQTQVARVEPSYIRFLQRFPSATECSAASLGDVLRLWAGLGYNRRAAMLHAAATVITERYGGCVPEDLDALRSLPGVGPYTARAVLAFAFERDVAVLDTNVARIVARAVAGRRLTVGQAQQLADELVPFGAGWSWNQAMLDLGAMVCTKRAPACASCPVAHHCVWQGGPGPDPAVGSGGTSGRQSRFEGSDRQGRGRLLSALRSAAVEAVDIATIMGWPDDRLRAEEIAAGLVAEGLAACRADGSYVLP